uniref:NFACT RNA-binding domain-containing protein n=1 Tax=Chromera velia CCMP2878 TaxID=1169474 RepID=A0A0G4GP25_9ALVE|mmetsp:Transcript_41990/g.82900  ORF Transcript_41990/g.82900 Transcript_41990/m.82900 type:complete len:228 (+) Transcript_41990:101-784(+)|eukprot:Cvel_5001.t1-p1 / transcript=Cvel_5001.t1 / gene=Cvel_5001 / organism=Chromera_velia_CCMP2878 / gene_product=Coiled-coil domain-containing protein 25, putative / transcript_product=Coiled-coil domain-containing protein 25, putative / location=Cvel_scaffold226:89196-92453(+) / protein_length=227 / sequence_SO=supercontig / SO=protein_coding / is_pseudo=false
MVFFYSSTNNKYIIYMGRDKWENEELIEHGHPEDIWFHVDKLSSAHVYLRLPLGETSMDSIPQEVLDEMCQLTKENSIEGCKAAKVDIVYTPWANLKKTQDMDVGQVGFKDRKNVKFVRHVAKDKEAVKRLEKTKTEKQVKLAEERQLRDREMTSIRKREEAERKAKEKEEMERLAEEKKLKSYETLFQVDSDKYTTNKDNQQKQAVGASKKRTPEEVKAMEEDFFM